MIGNRFTNQFQKQLLFELDAQSDAPIAEVALFVQVDGIAASSRQIPEFAKDSQVQAKYEWNLGRSYLPPGVTGRFWWMLRDSAGNELQTAKSSFRVEDVAYSWAELSNANLTLHWYAGNNSFGQALFERAVLAMGILERDTGVAVERPIHMWIYGKRSDYFRALEPGAAEWTGGRAFPDFGIIAINIEPNELEWGKRVATHELAHILIRGLVNSPLGELGLPQWLDEGLAVYYETIPGALDQQFQSSLNRAIRDDTLAPIRTLTGSFPSDPRAANLAYAESYSVVDFIIRRYGQEKLAQLLQVFKRGAYYDDALQEIFSVDADGLEAEWRKDIGAKPRAIPTRTPVTAKPTPFPTFSLSTDPMPTPTPAR